MPSSNAAAPADFYSGVALWRQLGASAKLVGARGSNMALADTIMYTVPANKKAVFAPSNGGHGCNIQVYNPTAGATTVKLYVVPAGQAVGLNYEIHQIAAGANASPQLTVSGLMILNAGDQVYVNPGVAGLNIWLSFIEADAGDFPLIGGSVSAVGTTATLIVTVPAGKKAYVSNSSLGAFNQSGLAATFTFWLVPNGGVADNTNIAGVSGSTASLARAVGSGAPAILSAGDAIYAASSAAGAFNIWASVALEPL